MPSGNDRYAPPPCRPAAPHVREGRRSCLSRRTRHHRRVNLPLRTRSSVRPRPHRRSPPQSQRGGPQAHRTSAGSLPLGLAPVTRSSQAVSVLPSLVRTSRPSPPSCSAPLCDVHIYPSSDPVRTPPLRVCTVSLCLQPHPDRDPRSSSSYGAPLLAHLLLNHPAYRPSPHTPPPRSARAGPLRHSPLSTQPRAPRRPSPWGATSPARAPPRNPRRPLPTTSPGE
ncbi:hypothetical protein B0H14DRAFT_894985 [Mycena olivaceomarginata]|nr:hypothetical protein B0H14DRAFT_894985 [Mycena olivaceomarginata]